MATRRQPLIPGWLIPGVSAATLVVAVALAAFLALWWNAPQGNWVAIWQDSYLWHVARFSFWQAFLSALLSVVPAIFLARALLSQALSGSAGAVASVRNDLDPPGAGCCFRHS
ncbi:thiamine ABC transport system, permease protein [Escherichia coli]|uniref:Thiamine ABC transport system, permease protein n=1 Tax=Escherichia coli TaxID=562 RepID=A0A2X1JNY1_ECOLX|nr:thiamine ABC transport system, permease protein [Escherichia coli]